ncbi:ras-related protein Rab-26-like isoform X1 [Dipodomys merriami]|uniref:ras-related protein Rab-26-like isoform X1 n=1 Tax=Dipodomys merriami TaxID=94247 RepID=UPI0038559670
MSRKKAPRSKGARAPAASALPSADRPRSARPGPEAAPPGPPQPGPPSLGGGDFYDVAFKVMLVGDSGVGKTCLLVRFKDGAFLAGAFISTVGIDFRNKVLDVDGMKVKLQIWDTAGQERFRSVTHAYYRDAHALLLLYDVTNKASFDNIQAPGSGVCEAGTSAQRTGAKVPTGRGAKGVGAPTWSQLSPQAWLTEIQEYAQHNVVLMLLGNKVDSAQERVVRREDGEKLAKEYGLPFMETSAKTGINVDLAFTAIAKELKQRCTKGPSEPCFRLHDYVKREGRGAACCHP